MFYLATCIIILGITLGSSFLSPGAIVLLDSTVSFHPSLSIWKSGWESMPDILVAILGVEWGSKIYFAGILIIAFLLGILLTREVAHLLKLKTHPFIEIFLGTFFLWNPFAYERMMTQPNIYLGIIFLGYTLTFLLRYHRLHTWQSLIPLTLSGALSLWMFPHAIYMLVLIFGLYTIFFVRTWREFGRYIIVGVGILSFNSFWLLAPILDKTNSLDIMGGIGTTSLEAFLTQGLPPLDPILTSTLLHGFWSERFGNHFILTPIISRWWYIAGGMMIVFIIGGWFFLLRQGNTRKWGHFFSIILVTSLVLGVGLASPFTAPFIQFAYDYLPFFLGYREPQKWVGLVMIVYALFLSTILLALFSHFQDSLIKKIGTIFTVLTLLTTWSPGPLFGYHDQIKPIMFPRAYEDLREYLMQKPPPGKVLVYPWEMYLACSWTNRSVIMNPIQGFFSPLKVVVPNNINLDALSITRTHPLTEASEIFLKTHDTTILKNSNISHIILMRECADAMTQYRWISDVCTTEKTDKYYTLYNCQK